MISTITAIFALAVALISSALLPVDIFLVSYMKNPNGTFKVWTSEKVSCLFKRNSCVERASYWVVKVFNANTSFSARVFGKLGTSTVKTTLSSFCYVI